MVILKILLKGWQRETGNHGPERQIPEHTIRNCDMAAAARVDGAAKGAVRTPVYFLSHGGVGAGLDVPLREGCIMYEYLY